MQPKDMMALSKEDRGVRILKENGKFYDHKDELDQVKACFKNLETYIKKHEIDLHHSGLLDKIDRGFPKLLKEYETALRELQCYQVK